VDARRGFWSPSAGLDRARRWPALRRRQPANVVKIVEDYGKWLARCDVPKLFINAEPGALLTGRPREFCRTWPSQAKVTVAGRHFVQEDSPEQIGQAIRAFVEGLRRPHGG
jgi:haloalkane dehalogenase